MSAPYYFDPSRIRPTDETLEVDLCVVGGVAAGVAAAVQAARLGRSVVVLEPSGHLGGMTSGGLGFTDFGRRGAVGGLAREFYQALGRHYGEGKPVWKFEPSAAEGIFTAWIAKHGIPVRFHEFVDRVTLEDGRIAAITTLSGLTVKAPYFLDCTYEGDLMARAGVTYTVGRESNAQYGEQHNGSFVGPHHQFNYPVDPYRERGAPGSGLLPGIDPSPVPPDGTGDRRVQAYNFRLCMTRREDIRVPFEKPEGYEEQDYELLFRYLEGPWDEVFRKFDGIPNDKTDTNNHGAVSSDYIGQNHAYPEAGHEERERIFQAHVRWHKGLLWTLANHPRIPARVREPMSAWGLAEDEFADTGHWPFQMYVREARRMVSDLVMTEHHVFGRELVDDPLALAAYGMDSHNCRRGVRDGAVVNEGDVQVPPRLFVPYPIGYRAIVPRRGECANLLVPVCLSATHITFGSIRMEPVFMELGQSAAVAAHVALTDGAAVQDIAHDALAPLLRDAGQVLAWTPELADEDQGKLNNP